MILLMFIKMTILFHELIEDSNFTNIQDVWIDKNDILWIADSSNSLLKYENFEFS